ncbi:MAG: DNA polymerase III subunit alpha, partial [Candidatus Aureabacteria bacterium]|nr:DNA polymerase III subunit alpha [Candidatus Auribacterota bacterium]
FLMVRDIVHYAKENGILVGPGRGSAAGSIVSYILGITKIDPLKYNLLFERFLNPDRISMPDIDIDFNDTRRGEVISYIVERYGKENVAQIITFGTLGAKAVVRDVARVLGFSYQRADTIAKMIPAELNITLRKALDTEVDLRKLYEEESDVKKLFDIAFRLEGLPRNASTHAAGVIISDEKLWEYVPVCRGQNGEIVTQYSMYPLEKIGLLKMDILGLKTLTVINDAVNIVKRTKGIEIDMDAIDFSDKNTYDLLNKANTIGVFQLESSGMRELCRKIGLTQLEEIIALIALYRPGPMNMLEDYVQRKHGKIKVSYYHPLLEPVLKNTYGIMLYQEQVMQTASVLAGFTLAQADTLRRIMGKKITEKMREQEEIFIRGALKNKIKKDVAEKVFEAMAYFAGYGFNKSHSTAYAFIAYQTAYLKANYPVEFMASLLSSEIRNTDKITRYIEECKNINIRVLPPDINESFSSFTVVGDTVRFGLAAVKNVGEAAVSSIIKVRKEGGRFTSVMDFFKRVDSRAVNKKVIESLVRCGAFQSLHPNRAELFHNLDNLIDYMSVSHRDRQKGQISLFSLIDEEQAMGELFEFKPHEEWVKNELLKFEKELLGFYVTGHPLSRFEKLLKRCSADETDTLKDKKDGEEVRIGGIIASLKIATTRAKGEKMGIIRLEDLKGSVEVIAFPSVYKKYQEKIIEGAPVFVFGRMNMRDDIPKISVQDVFLLENFLDEVIASLYLNVTHPDKDIMSRINSIIDSNPGKCPVYLDISFPDDARIVIKAGDGKSVIPSEKTVNQFEDLLGEDTVWLKVANGNGNHRNNNRRK